MSKPADQKSVEPPNKKRKEKVDDDLDEDDSDEGGEKRSGRRKINIEFIEDKSRRHITFSKRKAGIMKKAYELSTLTGTQVLLLVASETGHVYTFATPKLQPLITKPEGKNLIQSCLNSAEGNDEPPRQAQPQPHEQFDQQQGEPALQDSKEANRGAPPHPFPSNFGPYPVGMPMSIPQGFLSYGYPGNPQFPPNFPQQPPKKS